MDRNSTLSQINNIGKVFSLLDRLDIVEGDLGAEIENKNLTISEIRLVFGLNPNTLRKACQRGSLPADKLGSQWVIQLKDIVSYIDSKKKLLV